MTEHTCNYKITIECSADWNSNGEEAIQEVLKKLDEIKQTLIRRRADDILMTHSDGLKSLQGWWSKDNY